MNTKLVSHLLLLGLGTTLLLGACTKKVQVPPRMDLRGYGTLGIARFDVQHPGNAEVGTLAASEFVNFIHRGQPGVPVVELRAVSSAALRDPAELKRVAKENGIDLIILGDVSLTEVKPKLTLGRALTEGSLEARMEGLLHASIVDGKSGASIWSGGWRASESVAHVGVERHITLGTVPTASVGDVDASRGRLVRRLAEGVTRDFRPRIVKQR